MNYLFLLSRKRPEKYLEFDSIAEFPYIWTPTTYFVNEMTEEKSAFKWLKIVSLDLSKHKITNPNIVCRLYANGTLLLIERYQVQFSRELNCFILVFGNQLHLFSLNHANPLVKVTLRSNHSNFTLFIPFYCGAHFCFEFGITSVLAITRLFLLRSLIVEQL